MICLWLALSCIVLRCLALSCVVLRCPALSCIVLCDFRCLAIVFDLCLCLTSLGVPLGWETKGEKVLHKLEVLANETEKKKGLMP